MARRPPNSELPSKILTADEMRRGIERLRSRITELEAFDPNTVRDRSDPRIDSLESGIDETLSRVFGQGSSDYKRYLQAATIDTGPHIIGGTALHLVLEGLERGKGRAIALLQRAIQGLEEAMGDLANISSPTLGVNSDHAIGAQRSSRKIFIVHGHDEGAREAVARFVEKIGFEPVILHEQASRGRTVIEKVEAHSDVGFAVVLLTPDDVGGPNIDELKPRARQNVLLELGYFVGRLGRNNVCAIKRGDVDLPSDFGGVVWTAYDDGGGWRTELGKELQAAGFDVDWNKVMRS
jgi:predicted nucleotide-binding protein